ncbi:hypothetical protein BJY52DRAFT_1216999 [Lactarius psammicola]|nr:hypothetical protein BJY52DRAFT_1216999 [Lactarius psammicola]
MPMATLSTSSTVSSTSVPTPSPSTATNARPEYQGRPGISTDIGISARATNLLYTRAHHHRYQPERAHRALLSRDANPLALVLPNTSTPPPPRLQQLDAHRRAREPAPACIGIRHEARTLAGPAHAEAVHSDAPPRLVPRRQRPPKLNVMWAAESAVSVFDLQALAGEGLHAKVDDWCLTGIGGTGVSAVPTAQDEGMKLRGTTGLGDHV